MKKVIILISILLLLWIAGSSYMYVCKIRKHCCVFENAASDSLAIEKTVKGSVDSLQRIAIDSKIPVPTVKLIYFESNKSTCEMTDEYNTHFELIKKYLSANSNKKVRVTGYSDALGSEKTKHKISTLRADFIKQKLVEAGVSADAIETKAESDHNPAADNSTPEGRAKNRRTEILIK